MKFRPHAISGTGNAIGISESAPQIKPKKKKDPLLRVYPKTVDSFLARKGISVELFKEKIGFDLYNKIKKSTADRFVLVGAHDAELIAKTLGVSSFNLGTSKRYMAPKAKKLGHSSQTIPVNDKFLKELVVRYGKEMFSNRTNLNSTVKYYLNAITLKPGTIRRICSDIFAIDGTAEEYTYSKLVN